MQKTFALFAFSVLVFAASKVFAQPGTPRTVSPNSVINSLGMEFITIPSGDFMMGSDDADIDLACSSSGNVKDCKKIWTNDEAPKHKANIPTGILMMRFEITQAQWHTVMGTAIEAQRDKWGKYSESLFFVKVEKKYKLKGVGPDIPMYWVSWSEVNEFVKRMNDRKDGLVYSLPSEAEWEYGCRAGTSKTVYSFGT